MLPQGTNAAPADALIAITEPDWATLFALVHSACSFVGADVKIWYCHHTEPPALVTALYPLPAAGVVRLFAHELQLNTTQPVLGLMPADDSLWLVAAA